MNKLEQHRYLFDVAIPILHKHAKCGHGAPTKFFDDEFTFVYCTSLAPFWMRWWHELKCRCEWARVANPEMRCKVRFAVLGPREDLECRRWFA